MHPNATFTDTITVEWLSLSNDLVRHWMCLVTLKINHPCQPGFRLGSHFNKLLPPYVEQVEEYFRTDSYTVIGLRYPSHVRHLPKGGFVVLTLASEQEDSCRTVTVDQLTESLTMQLSHPGQATPL